MSIRLIAQDLYRLIREVEALEKRIETAPREEIEELKDRLRRRKGERDRIRRMLDGDKEAPPRSRKFL